MPSRVFTINFDQLPPPLNQLYRRANGGGMYKIAKASEWAEAFGLVAKSQLNRYPTSFRKGLPTKKPVHLEIGIWFKRDRDIDGSLKLLLDSLEGVLYVNDKQVSSLAVTKQKNTSELIQVKAYLS